jgi:ribosomal protein S18 acetylase RimI-like enzyme
MTVNAVLKPGDPSLATEAAGMIFNSSPELLSFMFGSQPAAETAVSRLYRIRAGYFGHQFSHIAEERGSLAGLILGYGADQLAKQAMVGSLALLVSSPPHLWWHLIAKVNGVVDRAIPAPGEDCYYINNLAVDKKYRGNGIGTRLLQDTLRSAHERGYGSVELDVAATNINAIALYERHDFRPEFETRMSEEARQYGLPDLLRMRRVDTGKGQLQLY